MKAKVQYDDYCGTVAADRSDFLVNYPGKMTEAIVEVFKIPLMAEKYEYVGVSVSGTKVDDVGASFYFKNKETQEVVKYFMVSVKMQSILDLFKRFEFQVGINLDDIDENKVNEIREE